MAVCFVDQRQFGRWLVTDEWDRTRGPCPLTEYSLFRQHVLDSLDKTAMHKPLCEVMLDQKYFNGIGNYLRAEICHRAGVNPFASASLVLSRLSGMADRQDEPDVLRLCHDVPMEVYTFGYRYGSMNNEEMLRQQREAEQKAAAEEAEAEVAAEEDEKAQSVRARVPASKQSRKTFHAWLRCYEKHGDGMMSTVDGLGRAMWHESRWRIKGKSKAGSRRPRKGKTISGADREEDGSAAAQAESTEEADGSSSSRKPKKQKKQPKVKAAKSANGHADEHKETAASAKRASGRKRTRAADDQENTAEVRSKKRSGKDSATAAIEHAGNEDSGSHTQTSGRRRSSRLSGVQAHKDEPTDRKDEEEVSKEKADTEAAGEEKKTAASKKKGKTTGKPTAVKDAPTTGRIGRGKR